MPAAPAATPAPAAPGAGLERGLVWMMAAACGVAVANLYYIQPLLAEIGRDLAIDARHMGAVAAAAQIGVAVGMFLFVPLGDMFERRRLVVTVTCLGALTMAGMAAAQGPRTLLAASLASGLTGIVPHLLIPFAARLAVPAERGKIVGHLLAGLLTGVLLARTVSGLLSHALGWRAVYIFAAGAMLALALALGRRLPSSPPAEDLSYPDLLRSVARFVVEQPQLREAALTGAMLFGAFSVFWSTLIFRLGAPPYHYGSREAGLFGLIGVMGAAAAPLAGRAADRLSARATVGLAILVAAAGFTVFWRGSATLWGIAAGVVLLDLGVQAGHVANQTRIYSLVPHAGSRLNTVDMVSYFLGGACGSALGTYGWSVAGWNGACLAGATLLAIALAVQAAASRRRREPPPPPPAADLTGV